MVFHAYQFGCGIEKQKTDSRYVLEPVLTLGGVKLTALKPLR